MPLLGFLSIFPSIIIVILLYPCIISYNRMRCHIYFFLLSTVVAHKHLFFLLSSDRVTRSVHEICNTLRQHYVLIAFNFFCPLSLLFTILLHNIMTHYIYKIVFLTFILTRYCICVVSSFYYYL